MEGIKKKTHTQNFLVISTQNKKIESQKTQRINTPTKTQKKMENTYDWLNSFENFKDRITELLEEEGYDVEWEVEHEEGFMEETVSNIMFLMEECDLSEEGAFSQTIENLIRFGRLEIEDKTIKRLGWWEFNEAIGEGLSIREKEKVKICGEDLKKDLQRVVKKLDDGFLNENHALIVKQIRALLKKL